jgi:alkylation response protein AidB-like acyl-CoA dehydrogenase
MALVLTEEQELLRETARGFLRDRSPVSALRALRDAEDPVGFSRSLWKEMAELGWIGIVFPEDVGGAGLGYSELGIVLEELGRTLVAHPLLSTALLAGNALLLGGTEAQRKDALPAVARGERILALAYQEVGRYEPYRVRTRAERAGSAYRITGEKTFVLDGHVADQLLVLARTSGDLRDREGLTLFLVDAGARGLEVLRTSMIDSRNASKVRLDRVEVDRGRVVGQVDRAADSLDPVLDRATIALCAEMLGGMQEAFDRTVRYLQTRVQFGVPIGSFQALKHRAAWMFCEIELSRSVVMEALRAIDAGRPDVPTLAAAAKARCSDTYVLAGNEGIQMHGGIGMTDEEEIGFFLKRARAAEATLGDAAYHRDRYARLRGY